MPSPGEELFNAMQKHRTGTVTADWPQWCHQKAESKQFYENVAAEMRYPLLNLVTALVDCLTDSVDDVDEDRDQLIKNAMDEINRPFVITAYRTGPAYVHCVKCGNPLTGHEDESGTLCRWCAPSTPDNGGSTEAAQ